MRALVWFRNDLRLHDNAALAAAVAADELLLVYCLDPRHFEELPLGFRKTGVHRTRFLLESLADLREQLHARGADLMVRQGRPEEEIASLVKAHRVDRVYAQAEVTSEEKKVEEALRKQLTESSLCLSGGLTLYHPDDLPFAPAETPEPFKEFRHQGTKLSHIREERPTPDTIRGIEGIDPGPIPTLAQLGFDDDDLPANTIFRGGETAALRRLQHYFFDTEGLTNYKWTRNQSLGTEYSTKFSAWLSLGCLSPRRVYYAVKEYETAVKKNPSTYKLLFELLWRDFYKFLGVKYGDNIFHLTGLYDKAPEGRQHKAGFAAWCRGETGIPFVDAHMTELNQTGFMSNRGRVNVSTYLARDLGIDWTWGAAYFESRLVDYDVTSNWLNWYYQATVWRYTPRAVAVDQVRSAGRVREPLVARPGAAPRSSATARVPAGRGRASAAQLFSRS